MQLNFINELDDVLLIKTDEKVYLLNPQESKTINTSNTNFKFLAHPYRNSKIKISILDVWLGSFLPEKANSTIICGLCCELNIIKDSNDIKFIQNQSHPFNKMCYYSVSVLSTDVYDYKMNFYVANRKKILLKHSIIMNFIVSQLPLSIGCIINSFLQEPFDVFSFGLGFLLILIACIPAFKTHKKFKTYCQDYQADFFLKLPFEQRSDIDKVNFEIQKTINSSYSTKKEKVLAKILKKIILNIEKD